MQRRNLVHTLVAALSGLRAASPNRPLTQHSLPACAPRHPVVGAWHLETVGAPILHHSVAFHADGIFCSFQADGGFASDSESNGAGAWIVVGDRVQGTFLEFRYDRVSHSYLGSVRVSFTVTIHGDTLTGEAQVGIYDAQDQLLAHAQPTWSATRIFPLPPG